jgi:ABC-2 type transport system ATP-binding protein
LTPVIECERVTKRFGPVVALDALDLSVAEGKVVGYLGPNGAGKSTTIRILLDLARRDSGEVRVLGLDPRAAGPPLRARIGYLPGELRLDERLTVEETLRSWSRLRGGRVDERYTVALCDRLDLDRTRSNRGLSSGNRRKVGLVGAFMARPELLILDEPTSGVDPLVQETFLALVAEARDEGRSVFLSSHVLSEVERVADEVIVIRRGKVVATGDVDALRNAARQPFRVVFAGDAVPLDEVLAAGGVGDVAVHGRVLSGVVEGAPNALLGVLARHDVEHLVMPEPDLEHAFLQYYEEGPTPA